MLNKREYEISLWTHNDIFQIILGASDGDFQGQIINAKRSTKLNGVATLTFDVVMRYFDTATQEYIDNPRWYNQTNKLRSLLNDLKVKLIYNKSLLLTSPIDVEVYEYTVTKISEKRSGKNLVVSVSCEGLEVYELSKRGTEITLNPEIILDMTEAQLAQNGYDLGTIDFWLKEILKNSNWLWLIDMNHNISNWDSAKIYEKPHEVGWNKEGNSVIYDYNYDESQEKVGFPSIVNSNLYNITQTLCETFEVFCEYKYTYGYQLSESDSLYSAYKNKPFNIAKRQVRFFNKQIDIDNNYRINYGLNQSNIEREIDSKDLVTKMFVAPVESSYSDSGLITISDSIANITQDNFLLNFDYYIAAEMLSDAQIQAIDGFKVNIGKVNYTLNETLLRRLEYQSLEYDLQANAEFYQSSYDALLETYNKTLDKVALYDNHNDSLTRKMYSLREEQTTPTTYYVALGQLGLTYDSNFKAYLSRTSATPITGYTVEYDDFGYAKGLRFASLPSGKKTIYVDAMYNLYKYYIDVADTYNLKMVAAQLQLESFNHQLGEIGETDTYIVSGSSTTLQNIADSDEDIFDPYLLLALNPSIASLTSTLVVSTEIVYPSKTTRGWTEACTQLIDYYLEEKTDLINAFNNIMGVFLREGTWTPTKTAVFPKQFSTNINADTDDCYDIWDTVEYLGDIENWYYDESLEKKYYPYITLKTNVGVDLSNFKISNFHITDVYNNGQVEVRPKWEVNSNCTVVRLSNDTLALMLYTMNDLTGHTFTIKYGSSSTNLVNQVVQSSSTPYTIKYHRIYITNKNIIKSSINLTKNPELSTEYPMLVNRDYRLIMKNGQAIITLLYNNDMRYNETNILVDYQTNLAIEQLYLEATTVMETSSAPKVSYKAAIVDLSVLSEYDLKLPKPGVLTYITDDEMHLHGVKGLITEVVEFLDNPMNNTITVSNYETKFEDLFKRIVATSETITNKQASYDRATNAITLDGSIRADFLQKAFNDNANKILFGSKSKIYYDPQDGSMIIYGAERNQFGYVGVVRLMAGGIFMSNEAKLNEDGEIIVDSQGLIQYNYTSGITPNGINANAIKVGTLDVGQVNIMSGNNPCFTWNSTGLFAYDIDENGFVNTQKFVKFNEDGLSFVYGGNTLVQLDWTGFFLESESGNIRISSSEDIQVFDDLGQERIKIGYLDAGYYGLRIKDENFVDVLQTSSTGDLFLSGLLTIGPDLVGTSAYSARVKLGVIESYDTLGEITIIDEEKAFSKILSIINFNTETELYEENVAIYDSGLLEANNVRLTGEIIATSGSIGGFNINLSDIRSVDNQVIIGTQGIQISQIDEEDNVTILFKADSSGNVIIKGHVEATSGSFRGTLEALDGNISGILQIGLGENHLIIDGTHGELYSDNYLTETTDIEVEENVIVTIDGDIATFPISHPPIETSNFQIGENTPLTNIDWVYNNEAIIIDLSLVTLETVPVHEEAVKVIYTYTAEPQGFHINSQGEIYTNYIHLNSRAEIDDYLRIGEAYIYNPDYEDNDGLFMKVRRSTPQGSLNFFTLSTTGQLTTRDIDIVTGRISDVLYIGELGSGIVINGADEYIQSNSYFTGISGWRINNNGYAQFENVDIRGTLNSVIFQHNHIQAAGGTILVSLTDKISEVIDNENGTLTIKYDSFNDNFEDVVHPGQCYINNTLYEITSLISDGIIITTTDEIFVNENIIILPTNRRGIVINSTDSNVLGKSQSITFFTNQYQDGYGRVANLVLGDLTGITYNDTQLSDYGLFADNVYLQGSLISSNGSKTSGINTASNIDEISDKIDGETGKIILWAGANGSTNEAIQTAVFRVDSFGNMIATSGFFSGAIITDSKISASEISTAVLIGNGTNPAIPALIIRDASTGIQFQGNGLALMELNQDELSLNNLKFSIQDINENLILLTDLVDKSTIVDTLITYKEDTATVVDNLGLKFLTGLSAYPTRDGAGRYAAQGEILYHNGIKVVHEEMDIVTFNVEEIKMSVSTIFEDNIVIREKIKMEPVVVNDIVIGYDLFITD